MNDLRLHGTIGRQCRCGGAMYVMLFTTAISTVVPIVSRPNSWGTYETLYSPTSASSVIPYIPSLITRNTKFRSETITRNTFEWASQDGEEVQPRSRDAGLLDVRTGKSCWSPKQAP